MSADLEHKRREALTGAHMRVLEDYRASLAARHGDVPHFDPFDGGEAARCLLLLETPGPRAGAIRFVSRDNPTATARNITRFCEAAGLWRADMVLWNTVPWVIHEPGARNRAPRRAEIAAGVALLPGLLALLPKLRVVILSGRVARNAGTVVGSARPGLPLLVMPHPSPVYVNTKPTIAPAIIAIFREAAAIVQAG